MRLHERITSFAGILPAHCLLILLLSPAPGHAEENRDRCMALLRPIATKSDAVNQRGGLWTIFEESTILKSKSSVALRLDRKIGTLLFTLEYLCNTLDGVPLNDLAVYVSENLATLGEEKFRAHLAQMGENNLAVDTWIQFTKKSIELQKRKLNFESVKASIGKAEPLLNQWLEILRKSQAPEENAQTTIQQTAALTDAIEALLTQDANAIMAIIEYSAVPHREMDNSSGGY